MVLAHEIQRYLSDEPVDGVPIEGRIGCGSSLRESGGVLTTASVIALILLGGSAVSTWLAVRATRG